MKSILSSAHLLVFTRYPEPGTTKTRLAKVLGTVRAAKIQTKLTELTVKQVRILMQLTPVSVSIYFHGGSLKQMQAWLGPGFNYCNQGGGDLGSRMARASAEMFRQGFTKVVIIGTDCPELLAEHIVAAFKTLNHKDLVLGPAADGGYYLIGLSRHEDTLFQNIRWGTGSVLAQTLRQAAVHDLSISLLEELNDVDRPEDLHHISNNPNL